MVREKNPLTLGYITDRMIRLYADHRKEIDSKDNSSPHYREYESYVRLLDEQKILPPRRRFDPELVTMPELSEDDRKAVRECFRAFREE